jgi:hypothetical protein
MHRARAELTLALDSSYPLRHVPLRPDPLSSFARAMAQVRQDEMAEVLVDLMPVTPGKRRRLLRRTAKAERNKGQGGGGGLAGLVRALNEDPLAPPRAKRRPLAVAGSMELLEARAETRVRLAKLSSTEPLFGLQILVWAASPVRGRAIEHVHALVACFGQFADQNHFKAVGVNLGFVHLGGSDSVWRRRRFDDRAERGLFRPGNEAYVTAGEVAGLLKPPTKHCRTANVVRSGGVIPPPPLGLPTYRRQPDLLPLGVIREQDGERMVGLPLKETLFTAHFGRSGFGKTEEAIVQAVGIARGGVAGVLYNDPHGDALDRMAPYLTDHAERVVEVNLSRAGDALQAGWNPLAMEGFGPADIETKVGTVASAFAAALDWTDRNTRGLNLVAQSTQSLCELALQLPPDLAPTIFQITTILGDDDWRKEVLPFLSNTSQQFWAKRFARQTGGGEAITPVTNALDRLRASRSVAALFGQSRSTFDLRSALDEGKIVLLCPGGVGDKENLIHAMFLFQLFSVALSRHDIPEDMRRICHAFLDELQVADSGQAAKLVARMLREGRKFGLRLHAMVQQPTSLSKVTLTAMFTNRSHLFSTVVSHESAAVLANEWAGLVDPRTITRLKRYHFLASATLGGEVTPPFLVRGLTVEEVWGDVARPDQVAEMRRTIDRTMQRRPVSEVLADLDCLDERIVEYLHSRRGRASEAEPPVANGEGATPIRRDHVRHLRRH